MGLNTHGEFIKIGNFTAFIDGVKDKCQHDYSLTVFTLGNGDYLFERDYRCPTDFATQEYVSKVAEDRNTYISGGTSACSKCGKIYTMEDITTGKIGKSINLRTS